MFHTKYINYFILSYCCIGLYFLSSAQDIQVIPLIENTQLHNVAFFNLLEDKKGFVWVGSNKGVFRLDGKHIINYTVKDGLSSDDILGIVEDEKNRIWFCSFRNGLSYYDAVQDSFIEPKWNQQLCTLLENEWVDNLFLDKQGNIWIQKFAFRTSPFIEVYQVKDDSSIVVHSIKGDFNLDTFFESYQFNPKQRRFFSKIKQRNDNQLQAFYTPPYFEGISKKGIISYSALFPVDKKDTINKRKRVINKIIQIDTSVRLDLNYYGFWMDTSEQVYLPELRISDVSRLSNGSYIFATAQNGVLISPSLEVKAYKELFSNEKVTAIENIKDKLHVKTKSTLYSLGTTDRKLTKENTLLIPSYYRSIDKPSTFRIWNKYIINNNIYIDNHKVDFLDKEIIDIVLGRSKYIANINDSLLLVTSSTGFVLLNNQLEIVTNSNDLDYEKWTQRGEKVGGNTIWLSTIDAMFEYNYRTQQISNLNLNLPPNTEITQIKGNKQQSIFLGSRSDGVFLIRGDTITQRLTTKQQLCSNTILSMHMENDSTIWAGTTRGLNKITYYSSIDSIVVETYLNHLAVTDLVLMEQDVFLVGDGTLLSFPKKIRPIQSNEPAFYIEELKTETGNEAIEGGIVNLPREHNSFQINFVDINFNQVQATTFCYALVSEEKPDTVWKYTQNRSIEYSNLPPNRYSFLLTTSKELQKKEQALIKKVNINIIPQFRDTIYFQVLIYFITLFIIVSVMFFILIIVRRRLHLKKAFVESQLKLLRTQMNPHFIFNTLNAITGHIIDNNPWKSVDYLSTLANLVRQVLENSKHKFLPLAEEIKMLNAYIELEMLRLGDKYSITIESHATINSQVYYIPPMLLQPFVENAIIHGVTPKGKGAITISINNWADDWIEIIIEDNGVGRKQAQKTPQLLGMEKSAMGIENISNHIDLINKNYNTNIRLEIEDLYENGVPLGTKVCVYLPRIKIEEIEE